MSGKGVRSRSNAKSSKRKMSSAHNLPRSIKTFASRRWKSGSRTPFRRSSSEPQLKFLDVKGGGSSSRELMYDHDSFSNMLCSYSSSSSLSSAYSFYSAPLASSSSLSSYQGYNGESKVVVTVVVEGSPGPIRTMVKLGSSVEETINLVLEKFHQEGRKSNIQNHVSASYELHHSFFSLKSLNKSSPIGDAGSRNLYLRKSSRREDEDETNVSDSDLEIKPRSTRSCSTTFCLLLQLLVRRFGNIPCRTWKTIFCL